MGIWWSASKIHQMLTKKQGWSLQIASVVAGQRNEEDRQQYRETLRLWVFHSRQPVFIDETFKGRNASRRRRCWSPKNNTPIIQEKFVGHRSKKYSMLAACDVDGFIVECCDIILCNEDGTVDTERFLSWVLIRLCPALGRYDRFENRSIVVLDNATIHHDDRVVRAIEATGARVIYTAPYSPDLNPIEWMFAQYKKAVLRHDKLDWTQAHAVALCAVTPKNAQAYFRRCCVPGADHFVDTEKDDKKEDEENIMAAFVLTTQLYSVFLSKQKKRKLNKNIEANEANDADNLYMHNNIETIRYK